MPKMWFVETKKGTMDPYYNLDNAVAEARKRGTRYWDTEYRKYYDAEGNEA